VGLDLLRIEVSTVDETLTVYAGGIVEVNGALYKVLNTTTFDIDYEPNQYLVLRPSKEKDFVTLGITDTLGNFDNAKNGYYTYNATENVWERIINIYLQPHFCSPNNYTGTAVVNLAPGNTAIYLAQSGLYYYQIKGGTGGDGGTGGNGGNTTLSGVARYGSSGNAGKKGKDSCVPLEGFIRIDVPTNLRCQCGSRGSPGGDGGDGGSLTNTTGIAGSGGRGGRGGRGAPSYIRGGGVIIFSPGGDGGDGGTGGNGAINGSNNNASSPGVDGDDGGDGIFGGQGNSSGYLVLRKIA
jgi:hypothetical protein